MTTRPRSLRQKLLQYTAYGLVVSAVPAAMTSGALAQSAPLDLNPAPAKADAAKSDTANGILLAQAAPTGNPIAEGGTANLPPASSSEQITVTGSRVKRTNLESLTPVVTVSGADIQAKGLTNTADVINELPQAGVATSSSVNSNFSDDAAGLQIVNLRNLGSDRTLVLIDGRRTVGGLAPGQGGPGNSDGVDISTIPAYLIDKVDVVTGGGSSTYGSEAVAGVVNFRLKNSFNGVLINQQYGMTTGYGDDKDDDHRPSHGL